jgi:hypothetical protein
VSAPGSGGQPVFLTDLDRCEPVAALSSAPAWRRWRTVAYEADGVAGTMLRAGEETVAPAVTYPLEASGWHTIAVGLYRGWCDEVAIDVKLTDDPT